MKRVFLLIFILVTHSFLFSTEYVVQKNDTLWSISKKFNVDISLVEKINEITILRERMKIFIPDEIIEYVVKEKDTLTSISKKFSIPMKYIVILNNLPDEKIFPGQKIKIPLGKEKKVKVMEAKEEKFFYHTVRKKETLFSIARQYNITVENLKKWNNKSGDSVVAGEKLKIYGEKKEKTFDDSNFLLDENISFFLKDRGIIAKKEKNRRGLTLILRQKSEILSPCSGVVEYIGEINGYGKIVIIRNSTYKFVFGYLNEVYIKKGEVVSPKAVIGLADYHNFLRNIGVYVEIRKGKKYIEVEKIFSTLGDESLLSTIQNEEKVSL
jgi:LysM repeat protein